MLAPVGHFKDGGSKAGGKTDTETVSADAPASASPADPEVPDTESTDSQSSETPARPLERPRPTCRDPAPSGPGVSKGDPSLERDRPRSTLSGGEAPCVPPQTSRPSRGDPAPSRPSVSKVDPALCRERVRPDPSPDSSMAAELAELWQRVRSLSGLSERVSILEQLTHPLYFEYQMLNEMMARLLASDTWCPPNGPPRAGEPRRFPVRSVEEQP